MIVISLNARAAVFNSNTRIKNKLSISLLLACSFGANAQFQQNNPMVSSRDSFEFSHFQYETIPDNRNALRWIVPGTMILYGFLTLHLDPLIDVNENLQKEIWTDNPHKAVTIDNYLQFAPAAAVYGLNLFGVKGEHNLLDRTMIYAFANLIMAVSVFSLKDITHVQRPDGSDFKSFPSGHTAEAFLSAEFLYEEYKNISIWYGIGGYLVAGSVAYLRLYNNKHWFSDVVAGAGFGIISTRLSYLLYPKIKRLFVHGPMNDSMIMPYYQDKTIGINFVHQF
jgi:membrane-associated phospholipid phosphatase